MANPDDENEVEQQSGDGATGPAPAENVPDDYKDLADAARELEPSLKDNDFLPSGPTQARGTDGKFQGATGPSGPTADDSPTGATSAAPSQTGSTGATGASNGRDSDLTIEDDPHRKPKTKQLITSFQTKAVEARNERDRIHGEMQALQKRLTEAEASLKTIKAPKEMEEELATLRDRVRELDIAADPAMQKKYDGRIKSNGETAMGILKDQGLFTIKDKDGKAIEMSEGDKRALTAEIERNGFGVRGMARYISALEKAGEYEASERLRALARQNDELDAAKKEEIATWKADHEGFQAQRTRESKEANDAYLAQVKTEGETALAADLTELAKAFPYLNRPPEPTATDTAEQRAAKVKAIGEYDTAAKQLEEAVKAFNTDGLPPEQAAKAYGRLTAAGVQAVLLKQHIVPRLQKDLAEALKRAESAEGEVVKYKKAGTMNRAHSAAITQPTNNGKAPDANLSLEEAMRATAKDMGINV